MFIVADLVSLTMYFTIAYVVDFVLDLLMYDSQYLSGVAVQGIYIVLVKIVK